MMMLIMPRRRMLHLRLKHQKAKMIMMRVMMMKRIALFVRKFKRFMKKKKYPSGYSKKGQSSKGNPFEERRYFECGEKGHISTNYKNEKEKHSKKKKESDGKKLFNKYYKKKKDGQACYVEWDSDASSSSDSDDEKSSQKSLASVAIKEAHSLFSTPYCLMAKGDYKVLCDEDEYSYDDLVELINGFDDFMSKEIAKFKELKRRHISSRII